jgi:2-oxoisovalerate dehydrogenase E1 component alpha subunit
MHDEPIQLLAPDGKLCKDDRLQFDFSEIDIVSLYEDMVLSRQLDAEAIALQRQGELGLWPSLLGQEAAQIGAARALRDQDMVFPTYREHGVVLCRGIDPVSLLGLFRGTSHAGWHPRKHNVNIYTLVIGAQTLHAAGYAMGVIRDGAVGCGDEDCDVAVLAFLGDGALSEGETNESFIWAATQDLPIVYFCQNNQWAISAPYSVQSRVPAAQRAAGFGFPGVTIDGNDVLACIAATRRALDRARSGGGPTLIEALTYRINPHTTSDDSGRYQDATETERWRARDPIERVRRYLEANGLASADLDAEITAKRTALGNRLRAECRALPDPASASPFTHTYVNITDDLRDQSAEFCAIVQAAEEAEL